MKRGSQAISDDRTDSSGSHDSLELNVTEQAEEIYNIASAFRGNPGRLTNLLSALNYEEEAYDIAIEKLKDAPKHIIKAASNALIEIHQKNRASTINIQVELIKGIIADFKGDNYQDLTEILLRSVDFNRKKFKPDSFELVLKEQRLTPRQYSAVRNAYLERKIGEVKDREFDIAGEKETGASYGSRVTKTKRNKDANVLKHRKIWMQKTGEGIEGFGIAENICEYIGANILNQIMGENSPKVRLHKDEFGTVTILSKFIEDFKDLSEWIEGKDYTKANDIIKSCMNFGNFFSANYLIADYDVHSSNLGVITKDDGLYLGRIDTGHALSYNVVKNHIRNCYVKTESLQSVLAFKADMLKKSKIYTPEMFEGLEFSADIIKTINDVDLPSMRKVIELSLANITKAYGAEIFEDYWVSTELKKRMYIPSDVVLDPSTLTEVIVDKIYNTRNLLDAEVRISLAEFFPTHARNAYNICLELKRINPAPLDYRDLLLKMQQRIEGFDLANPRHFQPHGDVKLQNMRDDILGATALTGLKNSPFKREPNNASFVERIERERDHEPERSRGSSISKTEIETSGRG